MSGRAELYACVYAQEFPAQALLRLRPGLRDRAVAVIQGDPPLQVVCALNAKARRVGVERGMTQVELDTCEPEAVLLRSAAEEAATRATLLECAGTFSPRVEECAGEWAFVCVVDIAGTEKLFGPPQVLAGTLLRRVRALGVVASVAVSSNFDAAVCLARGGALQKTVVPLGAEATALAALPVSVLELSEEHEETLEMWGIRTLGALAELPERELIARLGQEGKLLRQRARGESSHLFVPVEPEFRLEERMELDAPVEMMESLLFGISVMLEQLVLRATARVLALASVTVSLDVEGSAKHVRTVRPALPSNDRAMWLKLVQMDLEMHPPCAAVLGITLTAEPGTTSKVQMGLFQPQLPEPMRLDVTLARIAAIVGEECVGRPALEDTHRPDGFRMERFVVPSGDAASGKDARGPVAAMRQLRPAERVGVTVRGRQPASLLFRERWYAVERAYGPWVSSGDWWVPSLWGVEQWDLIARGKDGAQLYCCAERDLVEGATEREWRMVALYD